MTIGTLIKPGAVICRDSATSKKRALEKISEYLSAGEPGLTSAMVFDKLLERERLGSTGLGEGVAIPHCRMAEARQAIIALVTLDAPIDFDARDKKPVDILFALVVPEKCNETHLKILASAAEMFSDPAFCRSLRDCRSNADMFSLLSNRRTTGLSA